MFSREPVAIAALVRAVILFATAFGLKLSAEQVAAIMLVVEAVLALITRQTVTPMATLPAGVAAKIANEQAAKP